MNKFAWLDLETTGFEPHVGHILEVGIKITDLDLAVQDEFRVVVNPNVSPRGLPDGDPVEWRSSMNDFARDAHAESGLLEEVEICGIHPFDAQASATLFMDKHFDWGFGEMEYRPLLGGSSIHFDRAWLKVHMRSLLNCFHYRNLDVTSVGELARQWYPDQFVEVEKSKTHRTLEDIDDTLAELRMIREKFWRDPKDKAGLNIGQMNISGNGTGFQF